MEQYLAYLERRIAAISAEELALARRDRKDEANLAKVKANILGVCKTVYETFCRVGKSDADYLQKLDELANGWYTAMEQAKRHGDVERAVIEEIKLETLTGAKETFLALREAI